MIRYEFHPGTNVGSAESEPETRIGFGFVASLTERSRWRLGRVKATREYALDNTPPPTCAFSGWADTVKGRDDFADGCGKRSMSGKV